MRKISHPLATFGFILFILSLLTLVIFSPLIDKLLSFEDNPWSNFFIVIHDQLKNQNLGSDEKEKLIDSFANNLAPSISVSAAVPKNPINSWVADLKNKELTLVEKERLIFEKEAEFNKRSRNFAIIQRLLVAGIIFLFGLVILNFYFDHERSLQIFRKQQL